MFANTTYVLIIPKARNRTEANSNTRCSRTFKSRGNFKFVEINQTNHKRFGRFQGEDAISKSD